MWRLPVFLGLVCTPLALAAFDVDRWLVAVAGVITACLVPLLRPSSIELAEDLAELRFQQHVRRAREVGRLRGHYVIEADGRITRMKKKVERLDGPHILPFQRPSA